MLISHTQQRYVPHTTSTSLLESNMQSYINYQRQNSHHFISQPSDHQPRKVATTTSSPANRVHLICCTSWQPPILRSLCLVHTSKPSHSPFKMILPTRVPCLVPLHNQSPIPRCPISPSLYASTRSVGLARVPPNVYIHSTRYPQLVPRNRHIHGKVRSRNDMLLLFFVPSCRTRARPICT